jgi:hypothetical protein
MCHQKLKKTKLKKGEIVAQHCGPTKWCDQKKNVTMISTYHKHDTRIVTIRGKEVVKPVLVLDYNKSMIGVDLKNQLLHSYLIERKHMSKWNMKLFHGLLEHLNSECNDNRSNTGKSIDQLSFRIQLVEGLLVKYACAVEQKAPGRHSLDNIVPCLRERHFVRRIPPTARKARPQKRCVVCQKRGKDTVYWCGVGLCIECFCDYHTQLNF